MGAKWRVATVRLENVNERHGFSECGFWLLEIASLEEESSFKTKCSPWMSSKRSIVNIIGADAALDFFTAKRKEEWLINNTTSEWSPQFQSDRLSLWSVYCQHFISSPAPCPLL